MGEDSDSDGELEEGYQEENAKGGQGQPARVAARILTGVNANAAEAKEMGKQRELREAEKEKKLEEEKRAFDAMPQADKDAILQTRKQQEAEKKKRKTQQLQLANDQLIQKKRRTLTPSPALLESWQNAATLPPGQPSPTVRLGAAGAAPVSRKKTGLTTGAARRGTGTNKNNAKKGKEKKKVALLPGLHSLGLAIKLYI